MKRLVMALMVFLVLLTLSCNHGSSSGGGSKSANFAIIAVDKTNTSYNRPSLKITIKNTGNTTGYNVGCKSHCPQCLKHDN